MKDRQVGGCELAGACRMERRTDYWCGEGERKGGRGKNGRIESKIGRKGRKKEDEDEKEK